MRTLPAAEPVPVAMEDVERRRPQYKQRQTARREVLAKRAGEREAAETKATAKKADADAKEAASSEARQLAEDMFRKARTDEQSLAALDQQARDLSRRRGGAGGVAGGGLAGGAVALREPRWRPAVCSAV